MRILAIGATGFIGRFVVEKLVDAGHEVAVLHRGKTRLPARDGVTEIVGDRSAMAERRGEFRAFRPDVAIDMILSSGAQARTTVEAFHGIARRLVAISSGDVYRAMALLNGIETGPLEPVPLTEDSALRTQGQTYSKEVLERVQGFYPWVDAEYDKVQVERAIASDPRLPATILRVPMVYGPGDPLHRLYPTVKRMMDGRPAVLLEQGPAEWVPCRGYVENVAHAIAMAATSDGAAGRIYNVAEPGEFTEAEWIAKIGAALAWTGRVMILPRERMPKHLLMPYRHDQHLFMDSGRIRRELGYEEWVPVEVALQRTVEWEQANPPAQVDPKQFDYPAEDEAIAVGSLNV